MEPVIEKIITSGSPLVICLGTLVVVVSMFLKFMEKQGESNRALFQSINDQNLLARKDTERALLDNAQSTRDNTMALRAVEAAVIKFSNHA